MCDLGIRHKLDIRWMYATCKLCIRLRTLYAQVSISYSIVMHKFLIRQER